MKYLAALSCIVLLALCISCSKTKDVTISLTNPHDTPVAYDGYYSENQGTQETMTGTTPTEYDFTLGKGDRLDGVVYKSDSTNYTDTLRFRIIVDGEVQQSMTRDIVVPTQIGGIQFQFIVQ